MTGFLTATPGNITDVRQIAKDIVQFSKDYNIEMMAYDSAHSTELVRMLDEEGYDMSRWVQHSQQALKMNSPCQELLRRVLRHELEHDSNPVERWQISNLVWAVNPGNGFVRPDKRRNREKVDFCSALIMAISVAADAPPPPPAFWTVSSSE
jgi:phage terminase large subunit-like protein